MEIERKFLIRTLPSNLEDYPCHLIEQAYLCTAPVVRIRRQDEEYILTYKGAGLMAREEYNLPLTREGYCHLLPKADGTVITKIRYVLPILLNGDGSCQILPPKDAVRPHENGLPGPEHSGSLSPEGTALPGEAGAPNALQEHTLAIELDFFQGTWDGLRLAEVEFPDETTACSFQPPSWFGQDVTFDGTYHNSWLSQHQPGEDVSL